METGKGVLITGHGFRLPLTFALEHDDEGKVRGHLSCDTADVDPAEFFTVMHLKCEGGAILDIIAVEHTDQRIAFIGRDQPQPK